MMRAVDGFYTVVTGRVGSTPVSQHVSQSVISLVDTVVCGLCWVRRFDPLPRLNCCACLLFAKGSVESTHKKVRLDRADARRGPGPARPCVVVGVFAKGNWVS